MRGFSFTVAISLVAGVFGPAAACRGMAHHVLPWMGATGPVLTVSSEVEHVTFDLDGVKGRYSSIYPRVELIGAGWSAGALLPFVDLKRDGARDERGFGNPRVYGLATISRERGLSAGVELDLPWGDDEIAGDHAEIIPFVSIDQMGTAWGGFASVGFRASLGDGHSHAPSQLAEGRPAPTDDRYHDRFGLAHDDSGHPDPGHDDGSEDHGDGHDPSGSVHPVDPHSDRELLYRVGIARALGASSIRGYLDGQSVLEEVSGPRQFTTVGVELGIPALGLLWSPGIELPVGPDRRLDSSIHLGVHALF